MKQFLKMVLANILGFVIAQGFFVFVTISILSFVIGSSMNMRDSEDDIDGKKESQEIVLLLNLSGEMVERTDWDDLPLDQIGAWPFGGKERPLSLHRLIANLKEAGEDEKVKGLYIKAGFLQAGWSSLTSLRNAIARFQETGKFVYAYSEFFTEKTYYVASLADQIYMYPEGGFELNGFSAILSFYKKSLEKLEVEPQIFRAGQFKSAVEPFIRRRMSDANKKQYEELLEGLWGHFRKSIAQSRSIEESEIDRIVENLAVTRSDDAVTLKLADEMKYEDQVLDFLRTLVRVEEDEELPFESLRSYSPEGKERLDSPSFRFMVSGPKKEEIESPTLAVIYARGEIIGGYSKERTIGSESLAEAFREIRREKNIKAVVLRINSPGGSSLASDVIWREVALTNKKVPVVVSFGDIAASGGYYMAAGAQRIYAEPTTITGSIGVFGMSFVAKDFFENKLGVEFDGVKTHTSADIPGVHRKLSRAEVKTIEKEVDQTYMRFLQVVAEGRKTSIEEVRTVAEGRVWTGTQALEHGLVDELGGLEMAIDKAAELGELGEDYERVIWPRKRGAFGFVFDMVSETSKQLMKAFFGDSEMWQKWQLKKRLESTVAKNGVYLLWPWSLEIQ